MGTILNSTELARSLDSFFWFLATFISPRFRFYHVFATGSTPSPVQSMPRTSLRSPSRSRGGCRLDLHLYRRRRARRMSAPLLDLVRYVRFFCEHVVDVFRRMLLDQQDVFQPHARETYAPTCATVPAAGFQIFSRARSQKTYCTYRNILRIASQRGS